MADLSSSPVSETNHDSASQSSHWLAIVVLWGLLILWSLLRSPIPSVNEPHYLCKARHFWDPTWCANDFFLASSNPHWVYYFTVGWMTQFLSLGTTALIARLVSLLIFAVGWVRMTGALLPHRVAPFLSLSIFLLLQAVVNFSGEWVIGGTESKVFSYGLGFWSLGCFLKQRWNAAGILMGLAIAFHPLVGIWLTGCLVLSALLVLYQQRNQLGLIAKKTLLPIGLMIVASLPGMIPALGIIFDSASPADRFAGDYLQVFFRLKHHLDPMQFKPLNYIIYLGLMILAVAGYQRLRNGGDRIEGWRLLLGLMFASALVAFVGILIGLRFTEPNEMPALALRAKLLKFYPFRLYDMMVPVFFSLIAAAMTVRWASRASNVTLALFSTAIFLLGMSFPFRDRNPSRLPPPRLSDWYEACDWARTETPPDTLFATPRSGWAFKWYAHRAEYVTFKDCPQDARGILEWNERLTVMANWRTETYADSFISREELARLRDLTGATYLVARNAYLFESEPVFQNESYRIDVLPESTDSAEPQPGFPDSLGLRAP